MSIIVKDKIFLSVQEVAERLKVSEMSIYRYIKTGKLKATKRIGKFFIEEDNLYLFISGKDIEEN